MKLPDSQGLVAPILKLVREKGQVSQADIYNFLSFEFGAYEGGPGISEPAELWRFTAHIQMAQKRLLRGGLLASPASGLFKITPRGEAFLAKGFTKLDAQAQRALSELPARELQKTEPVAEPEPAEHQAAEREEEAPVDIAALLQAAQIRYLSSREGMYEVRFEGNLRTWLFEIWQGGGWLCFRAHVMRLPENAGTKGALIEAALKANATLAASKLCVSQWGTLCLDAEYRAEHVDAEVLKNLLVMYLQLAEKKYPELVRIATGQAALDSLEQAFKRSA